MAQERLVAIGMLLKPMGTLLGEKTVTSKLRSGMGFRDVMKLLACKIWSIETYHPKESNMQYRNEPE
jgi:hypothetical protein